MSPTIVADDEPPPAASSGSAAAIVSSSSPISTTTDEIDLTNTDSEDENQGNNTTTTRTALSKGNLKVFSPYAKRLRRGTNAPKRYAEQDDSGDEYEKPMVVTPRKPKRAKKSTGSSSSSHCKSSPASTPPSATSIRSSTSKKKKKKTTAKKNEVKIGDIGYAFHKRFWVSEQGDTDNNNTNMKRDVEVFHGEVVGIIDGAYVKGEKDRRCGYNDGDEEDLSLKDLQDLFNHPRCEDPINCPYRNRQAPVSAKAKASKRPPSDDDSTGTKEEISEEKEDAREKKARGGEGHKIDIDDFILASDSDSVDREEGADDAIDQKGTATEESDAKVHSSPDPEETNLNRKIATEGKGEEGGDDSSDDEESIFSTHDEDEDNEEENTEQKKENVINSSDDDESLFSSQDEEQGNENGGNNEKESDDNESLFSSHSKDQCDDEKSESHVDIDIGNPDDDLSMCSRFSEVSQAANRANANHNVENEWMPNVDESFIQPVPAKKPKKKTPGTLVTAKHHPLVLEEDKSVSYLSLKLGEYMMIRKTHCADGPPARLFVLYDRVYENDRVYEIFNLELVDRGHQEGQVQVNKFDNLGKKYYKSYYRLQVPGTSLSSELLKIAAFDTLTIESGPQKTASRLKLLASTACNMPGTKEPCIHELPADMFEIIEDNGHLGCGYIPIDLLQEEILGNNAGACRANAIQVRIVAPTLFGVAKGVLAAKPNIKKIQVPTSMIKTDKSNEDDVAHTNAVLIVKQCFPSKNNLLMQRMLNPSHSNNAGFRKPPSKAQLELLQPLKYMAKAVLRANGCPMEVLEQYNEEQRHEHTNLVGISDPTGCIPEGHVFLTGFGPELPHQVFVTVTPAGEACDGVVVPVAQNLPAHARSFLENRLSFGAIVFALGAEQTLIPPNLDDADSDGDLYIVLWNEGIISMLHDIVDSSPPVVPKDDVVGIEFKHQPDVNKNVFMDAIVAEKLGEDEYMVNVMIKKKLIQQVPMTKEEIYYNRKFLSHVTAHRCSKKKTEPTQFHFTWAGGNKEWVTIRDVRAEFPCPPPALLEYAEDHRLLECGGPGDCEWMKAFIGKANLVKIKKHRVNNRKIELLCLYDDEDERWERMKDVENAHSDDDGNDDGNGRLQIAEYARDKKLFKKKDWAKTRDYWLDAVQDFYCKGSITGEVGELKSHLHGKFKECNNEEGPNDISTRLWVRAYKACLKIDKHGGKVKLPLKYYLQVSPKLQHLVDIV